MVTKVAVVLLDVEHTMVGLKRTVELAERTHAAMHVIDVAAPVPGWLRGKSAGAPGTVNRLERRRAMLEGIVSNVRVGDVRVTVAVRRGRRLIEMTREAIESGCDLLVLVAPAIDRSPTTTEAFINRAVRKSPTDVCVLRPPIPNHTGTAAAVDIDSPDRRLVSRILALTAEVTPTGDRAEVVHVLEVAPGWEGEYPQLASKVRRELAERRRTLEELVSLATVAGDVRIDVVAGEAVEQILEVVRSRHPDLLVLSTVSDAQTTGALLGNTAEALLREVECSVLFAKPPGFQTPLGPSTAATERWT